MVTELQLLFLRDDKGPLVLSFDGLFVAAAEGEEEEATGSFELSLAAGLRA